MAEVLVGMGSNIEPEKNLLQAATMLRGEFSHAVFSSVYCSAAVGMDGDDFLNACCLFASPLSLQQIRRLMKALEDAQGRDRSAGSWKPRTI
ncbi:MAG: 2-amino-4-hydroxy-6-hydroxymethyldihydropteridine diphosphokinase, partial [Mariprofundus sp.]|nr:2-amino-4-hydroxy-6-hydroxymethyldihydropteridine diphosphokinase [Mariprofundus sp.]